MNVPATQSEQVRESALYWPAEQAEHCWEPLAEEAVPGAQSSQASAPLEAWYVPGGHDAQDTAPKAAYLPASHGMQLELPSSGV